MKCKSRQMQMNAYSQKVPEVLSQLLSKWKGIGEQEAGDPQRHSAHSHRRTANSIWEDFCENHPNYRAKRHGVAGDCRDDEYRASASH
jgi:hypothetical protein